MLSRHSSFGLCKDGTEHQSLTVASIDLSALLLEMHDSKLSPGARMMVRLMQVHGSVKEQEDLPFDRKHLQREIEKLSHQAPDDKLLGDLNCLLNTHFVSLHSQLLNSRERILLSKIKPQEIDEIVELMLL